MERYYSQVHKTANIPINVYCKQGTTSEPANWKATIAFQSQFKTSYNHNSPIASSWVISVAAAAGVRTPTWRVFQWALRRQHRTTKWPTRRKWIQERWVSLLNNFPNHSSNHPSSLQFHNPVVVEAAVLQVHSTSVKIPETSGVDNPEFQSCPNSESPVAVPASTTRSEWLPIELSLWVPPSMTLN